MKFEDLSVGDLFNTKAARFVKTGNHEAIVVMSGVLPIGAVEALNPQLDVIELYCRNKARFPRRRPNTDWVIGEHGAVELVSDHGVLNVDAPLPEMDVFVECLFFDGHAKAARRVEAYHPGCGWYWQTDTGDVVAGCPLLISWRPIPE